jgi:hypothetical protein
MAQIVFEIPSFRTRVNDARILALHFLIHNPEGQTQFAHEVSMRSLILAEAHNAHSIGAAERFALELRSLANDLDALAHDWLPPLEEPEPVEDETGGPQRDADDPRTMGAAR